MQRVLITGSSGYLGQALVGQLRSLSNPPEIRGVDVCQPKRQAVDEFHPLDIRAPELRRLIERFQPDTVVHLAFVLNPIHSRSEMESINVEGTRNLLNSLESHLPNQLLVGSSATVFGAWPDRHGPFDDEAETRSRSEFAYSRHKELIEDLAGQFAQAHPNCCVSWVRPTTIVGPSAENFITRFIVGTPALIKLGREDVPFQFVHEEDVGRAILTILKQQARGPFNIAPGDTLTLREIAAITRKPYWRLPFLPTRLATGLAWKLRIKMVETPPGFLWFGRYPWTVSSRRLTSELDFEFNYSSRQALEELLRHIRGIRSGLSVYDYVRAQGQDQP